MISDPDVSFLASILKILTWSRLAKLALAVISLCGLIFFIEDVQVFSERKLQTVGDRIRLLHISRDVEKRIVDTNRKLDYIIAIQVTTLNFQRNVKLETFIDIDNPKVKEIYRHFLNNRLYDVPIFDSKIEDNSKTLRIVGGEFLCFPYTQSTGYKYAPEAAQYISHVCAIGIPPNSSNAAGILTIYFDREPTGIEVVDILNFSREISAKIYEDNKDELNKKLSGLE